MPVKTTTRTTTRQPVRKTRVRRQPLLVRAARATISPYDRRAAAYLMARVQRVTRSLARRLGITTPARARAVRYAAVSVLVLVALLLTATGTVR
jgi:hypothetical protein